MAANQLAFERQEPAPVFIKNDYWQPQDQGAPENEQGEAIETRGITGSARLLQDIYQLDQHAFQTEKRKLQLVEHISLAEQFPFEFQEFKRTGVLPFNTDMELFDKGFPGHYLRLIKKVRLSVIGLIPPRQGLRASLSSAGVSRVVTGKEVFRIQEIRRPSESISFTSTNNATGLFELYPENELLLPFEGMGVDASWELQVPKPANQFNYDTLSDVIFTIEYTALNSFDYREQVVQQLDRSVSAELALSVNNDFPDSWYHLLNTNSASDSAQQEVILDLEILENYFPHNLENITIDHVSIYFVRDKSLGTNPGENEINLGEMRFTPTGSIEHLLLSGTNSINGLISTRRSNASTWIDELMGISPAGKWSLIFNDRENNKKWFESDNLKDILFIVSYTGETPDWQ